MRLRITQHARSERRSSPAISIRVSWPGTFVVRHREEWNARVVANVLKFELEAGTSDAVLSPGTVRWDNFKAVAY